MAQRNETGSFPSGLILLVLLLALIGGIGTLITILNIAAWKADVWWLGYFTSSMTAIVVSPICIAIGISQMD